MSINWRAIVSGLLGGAIAAVIAGYATTSVLDATAPTYTTSNLVWTAVVGLLGGVLGTLAGWVANGRRGAGLSGIAALTAFVGAVGATLAWGSEAGGQGQIWLFLISAIILLGLALVGLAAVCGLTVAVLMPVSLGTEPATEGYVGDRG